MKTERPLRLPMQYFADEGEGKEDTPPADSNSPEGDKPPENSNPPVSITQEDVQKLLEDAKETWKKEFDNQLIEAQKVEKMTKEQKAQYEKKKQESELAKREAEITQRELKATAKEQLLDKKLPVELAECLRYEDADAFKSSMEAVEKAFKDALEKAVNDKLRGGKAPKDSGAGNTESSYAAAYVKKVNDKPDPKNSPWG